jgi:DNA-binding IclR family transcriptional regulator
VAVLEVVAAVPNLGLSDIADRCGLPTATSHRLIQALVRGRLLVAKGSKRKAYALGSRLLTLLQSGADEEWLRGPAQRTLDWVAGQLGETCFLAKLAQREVVSIGWATPPTGLSAFVVPGLSQPLHAAACAKAILAHRPTEFLEEILSDPLPKLCSETKTRRAEVLEELREVRARGYATCWNENEAGIAAVACPIFLPGTDVICSIGVTGLQSSIPLGRFAECAAVLASAASEMVDHIIHRPELTAGRIAAYARRS